MDNIEHSVNEAGSLDTIGARLRAERERVSLSQEAFAKMAGVHRRTQVNYEAGERKPDADYLAAIAGFGVDITYVVTGRRMIPVAQLGPDDAAVLGKLVDAIQAVLKLYNCCRADWQSLFDLAKAELVDQSKGIYLSRGVDSHCQALLSKSPYIEFNADRTGDLLERVEFVAESEGRVLSARDKLFAVLSLREENIGGASPPSLAAVKAVVMRLGECQTK